MSVVENSNLKCVKLIFDKSTWEFRLKPVINDETAADSDDLCIKELSPTDVQKITRKLSTEDRATQWCEFMCCISGCRANVNGICIAHPMVFVKENPAPNPVYSVADTVPEFFCIAKSTIPDAGSGVFTRIALPAGVAFGPYAGFITYSKRAIDGACAWEKYRWGWSTFWVDAKEHRFSNWLRCVNCPRWEEEQTLTTCYHYGQRYYYTYKPVEAGSELLVWYGQNYAQHLGISIDYGENCDDFDWGFAPKKKLLL